MNISGIRPYMGYYDYNSIQRITQNAEAEQTAPVEQQASSSQLEPQQEERDYAAQTFGAADYAKQYQPDAVYDMKGEDSDIRNLDVERALSDMQKDQVLQQYQYFVGVSQENVRAASETGVASVRTMENFTL